MDISPVKAAKTKMVANKKLQVSATVATAFKKHVHFQTVNDIV